MEDFTYTVLNPDDIHDMPLVEFTGLETSFIHLVFKSLNSGHYPLTVTVPANPDKGTEEMTYLYGMEVSDNSISIRLNNGKVLTSFISPNPA